MLDPTQRFTGRVESYRQYRPTYPRQIVDLLRRECGLREGAPIADIAAGTGLLAEIFLASGFPVTAVEPNAAMRSVCAALEEKFPALRCLSGTAESTGLPNRSVDLVTVGQALHWFDLPATRAEFARILRPRGWCAVVYNERHMAGDAFHNGYERLLLDFGTDYLTVQRQHLTPDKIAAFLAPAPMTTATFPNRQELTLEALEGRILSSSYMPQPGQPRFAEMRNAVENLFRENQHGGLVTLHYDCVVSYGQLA